MMTSTELFYCVRKGFLVGMLHPMMSPGQRPISDDDCGREHISGCNHLYCPECDRPIRWFDAELWGPPPSEEGWLDSRQEIERQYDLDDFAQNLVVNKFSHKYRSYACRCRVLSYAALTDLIELGHDMDWPWQCGGHKPPFDPSIE